MPYKHRADQLHRSPPPTLEKHGDQIQLSGDWTLRAIKPRLIRIRAQLMFSGRPDLTWDLTKLSRLDTYGALLLWRAWGYRAPAGLVLDERFESAFERVRDVAELKPHMPPRDWLEPVVAIGEKTIGAARQVVEFARMLGFVVIEAGRLIRDPRHIPLKEFSAALYKTGAQALPIAAMVGISGWRGAGLSLGTAAAQFRGG